MKTKEQQIAELLCNYSEDHFFNPASLGGFLADQPTYTLDRIMEVVAWVIEKQARRYEREIENGGMVSEGLAIAYKLDQVIDKIKDKNTFNNVKLPITNQERKAIIDRLPKENYQRLIDELQEYRARNMLNLLRWLKYFVDTCVCSPNKKHDHATLREPTGVQFVAA